MLPSTSTPVKRACDSCHRRKVKCIGEGMKPCKNCISAGLTCTYNAIPQKKGPKGSRAKVLSELRETQRQTQISSGFSRSESRSGSPVYGRTPGLLTPALLDSCLDFYRSNLYPSQPVLLHQRLQDAAVAVDHNVEAYSMLSALCAYSMIHANMPLPSSQHLHADFGQLSNLQYGQILLEESVRIRKAYNHIETPSTFSVLTSFFYHSCYFSLDKHNAAWYYLREATTQALGLSMHNEDTYKALDVIEGTMRRRLYWLLFITERAYAIHRHRSFSLYPTISLPNIEEDPGERAQLSGFLHHINLYKQFNDTFFSLWNKVKTDCMPSWIVQMQDHLSDVIPSYLECTETQAVDLRTTQQWLRTILWQLAISQGFVSSVSTNKTMSFNYPIEISRDLIAISNQFSHHTIEIHGMPLIEKIFDIACTLIDVLSCLPYPNPLYDMSVGNVGPREYLNHYVSLISMLRGGQSQYLPLLIARINDVLPNTIAIPASASFSANTSALAPTSTPASLGRHSAGTDDSPTFFEAQPGSGSVSAPASHNSTPYESPSALGVRSQGPSPIPLDAADAITPKGLISTPGYIDQHHPQHHLSISSVGSVSASQDQIQGLPVSMAMGMSLPVTMAALQPADGMLPSQPPPPSSSQQQQQQQRQQQRQTSTPPQHHIHHASMHTPPQQHHLLNPTGSQHLQGPSAQHFQGQQRTPSPGHQHQNSHLQGQHSLPNQQQIQQSHAQAQLQILQQQRQLQRSPFAGMGYIDDDGSSFYR